ncbi:MAG: hypothetical protein IMZ57_10995 [Acidobacteria bacterium]|nr:hypothetical protein [Acidobacteriota bacterium]
MKKKPAVLKTKIGKDFDTMIRETEGKFTQLDQLEKEAATKLNEIHMEINRLQGEYRLLRRMKNEKIEAEKKKGKITSQPEPPNPKEK